MRTPIESTQQPPLGLGCAVAAAFQAIEVHSQQVNPALQQYVIDTKVWAVGLYAFKFVLPNSPIEFNGKFNVVH